MPRLLQNERERAVGMFQAGMTHTEITNHFNCSGMTIYRLLVRGIDLRVEKVFVEVAFCLQLQTTRSMTFNSNRAHLHTF
jgi:hypothetical protein